MCVCVQLEITLHLTDAALLLEYHGDDAAANLADIDVQVLEPRLTLNSFLLSSAQLNSIRTAYDTSNMMLMPVQKTQVVQHEVCARMCSHSRRAADSHRYGRPTQPPARQRVALADTCLCGALHRGAVEWN